MNQEANPGEEAEAFSLEISGNGAGFTHSCPAPTMLVQARQGQRQSHRRTSLDCPMAPRPLSQLLRILVRAWMPFLHSHSCARPHTHHTPCWSVRAWPLFLWARGQAPPGTAQRVRTQSSPECKWKNSTSGEDLGSEFPRPEAGHKGLGERN